MSRKLAHEEAYRGKNFAAKLQKMTIVVCGVGALGSNLVDMLARQGFTNIRVIDMDRVEVHNVNTQIYGDADVGAMKVAALRTRIFRDTGVEIEAIDKKMQGGNIKKFLSSADLVFDTFDNSASRRMVHDYCTAQKIPCLHGGMFEGYGEVVWGKIYNVPKDAAEGAVDVCDYPLARNLVMLVVTLMAEEAIDFCVSPKPRSESWSITLKDMSIRKYR